MSTAAPVERVGDGMADVAEGAAAQQQVLGQTEGHPHCGEPEAPVEALHPLQQPGQQRAEQGTEVDPHVVDGEAGVATCVLGRVEVTEHRAGRGLEGPGAQRDAHEADPDPGEPGHQGQ